MPETWTYAGQVPVSYTEARDAAGDIVGTVEHGDTREFGEDAPDERWIPSGQKLAKAWPGVSADMYRLPEGAEDGADAAEGDGGKQDAGEADVPVTAPAEPAVSLPDDADAGNPAL